MTDDNNHLSRKDTNYAASHCTKCAAGWTRTTSDKAITICLLDRAQVLAGMTSCDRYEVRHHNNA
jgi:hypothetical protein